MDWKKMDWKKVAWKQVAWTALTVAAGFLSLTLAPTWSMAFLILFGMILLQAGKMMGGNQNSEADTTTPAHGDLVLDVDESSTHDAAAKNPESSSTSSSSSRFKYDVFLNLRGPDTRYGIADHLYRQLKDVGIKVFMDNYDLTLGNEISLELKGAIERSRISIAIFSSSFASSTWCLDDLQLMWECRETNGQTIIPIFYDVEPVDVRLKTHLYGDSLHEHEKRFDLERVKKWRQVLVQIARLHGFTRRNRNESEVQFIEEVVADVKRLLREDYQYADDKLVGIDHHVQGMMKMLGVDYREGRAIKAQGEEVRGVEIWGEQGVGKTTLAKAVFYKILKLFDAHSFLEIRSEGVQFLRDKLIADLKKQKLAPHESSSEETEEIASLCHDKKVLIVLDGVDKDEQIKALAGKLTWFGPGSRIIVTTNKKNIFKALDVGAVEEHTVEGMDQRHAHKLFCLHAFQGDAARDVSEYFGLSLDIAEAIGGLPSEIVHQASSLREEMNMDRWETTLGLLQKKAKSRKKRRTFVS